MKPELHCLKDNIKAILETLFGCKGFDDVLNLKIITLYTKLFYYILYSFCLCIRLLIDHIKQYKSVQKEKKS